VLPALIRRFHEAAERGDASVTCWGSGTPMREFLHGDDLGEACVVALEPWLLPRPLSCQPIWMPLSVRLWINRLGCTPVWQLMRLLLDTQVMLWWLLDDPRLSAETRDLMAQAFAWCRSPASGRWLSSTAWPSCLWRRLPFVISSLWCTTILSAAC
jgi:hypothetical protein